MNATPTIAVSDALTASLIQQVKSSLAEARKNIEAATAGNYTQALMKAAHFLVGEAIVKAEAAEMGFRTGAKEVAGLRATELRLLGEIGVLRENLENARRFRQKRGSTPAVLALVKGGTNCAPLITRALADKWPRATILAAINHCRKQNYLAEDKFGVLTLLKDGEDKLSSAKPAGAA